MSLTSLAAPLVEFVAVAGWDRTVILAAPVPVLGSRRPACSSCALWDSEWTWQPGWWIGRL